MYHLRIAEIGLTSEEIAQELISKGIDTATEDILSETKKRNR